MTGRSRATSIHALGTLRVCPSLIRKGVKILRACFFLLLRCWLSWDMEKLRSCQARGTPPLEHLLDFPGVHSLAQSLPNSEALSLAAPDQGHLSSSLLYELLYPSLHPLSLLPDHIEAASFSKREEGAKQDGAGGETLSLWGLHLVQETLLLSVGGSSLSRWCHGTVGA